MRPAEGPAPAPPRQDLGEAGLTHRPRLPPFPVRLPWAPFSPSPKQSKMEPSLTSRGLMFTLLSGTSHLATLLLGLSTLFCLHLLHFTVFRLSLTTFQILTVPGASLSSVLQTLSYSPPPTSKQQFVTRTSPEQLHLRIISEAFIFFFFFSFTERKTETQRGEFISSRSQIKLLVRDLNLELDTFRHVPHFQVRNIFGRRSYSPLGDG